MSYTYTYPRPANTTDTVVFNWVSPSLYVLLIQRAKEPFKGMWATPGGFVEINELCEVGAKRELLEETNIVTDSIYFSHIADAVERDPRGRIISFIYYVLTANLNQQATAGDDAACAQWFNIKELPELACDHSENIAKALANLFQQMQLHKEKFEKQTISKHDLEEIFHFLKNYVK